MPKSSYFLLCSFGFSLLLCRISLKKGQSIRDKMRAAGVLADFLKLIKYDPVKKYQPRQGSVVSQPITNHLDVSAPLPLTACPPSFPAARAIWTPLSLQE